MISTTLEICCLPSKLYCNFALTHRWIRSLNFNLKLSIQAPVLHISHFDVFELKVICSQFASENGWFAAKVKNEEFNFDKNCHPFNSSNAFVSLRNLKIVIQLLQKLLKNSILISSYRPSSYSHHELTEHGAVSRQDIDPCLTCARSNYLSWWSQLLGARNAMKIYDWWNGYKDKFILKVIPLILTSKLL